MKPKAYSVLLVAVFTLIPLLAFSSEETLTITTYYPSPYGSYRNLSVYRRLSIGNNASLWIDDVITGFTDGMQDSDAAIFVPVYTGGDSDFRLYIVDDPNDRFSIWGNSCDGGDCNDLNSATNIATFMGNGNVGIGTAAPNTQLHLDNASNVGPQITLSAPTGGTPGIVFRPYHTPAQWSNPAQAMISATDNNWSADIHFWTKTPGAIANALVERMTILGSGNVGIGTANPDAKLQVYANDPSTTQTDFTQALTKAGLLITTTYIDPAYTPGIFWSSTNAAPTKPLAGIYLRTTSFGSRMYFGTSNAYATGITNDAVVINELGNVGIGTTTPEEKLTIGGNGQLLFKAIADDPGDIIFQNSAGTQKARIWSNPTVGVSGLYMSNGDIVADITIDGSGNVGIGTTTPGYKLQVGNAGDGTQARAIAWNILSDIRLKTNLTKLTGALDKISQLNGYYFNWNVGIDKKRQVGIIAQEVEKVLPEVVSEDSEGIKSVEYGKLSPLVIEAIKELKAENDALKTRIEVLEAKLNSRVQ